MHISLTIIRLTGNAISFIAIESVHGNQCIHIRHGRLGIIHTMEDTTTNTEREIINMGREKNDTMMLLRESMTIQQCGLYTA